MEEKEINSINELQQELKNGNNYKLFFRGQSQALPPVPTAVRNKKVLFSNGFNKFVEPFKDLCSSITHSHVVQTFIDIFTNAYPKYTNISNSKDVPNIITDHNIVQLIHQVLRQQYSRSAMLLDVTRSLKVALFFGRKEFYISKLNYANQYLMRARHSNSDFVYLSVFKVPTSNIIFFSNEPNKYISSVRKLLENNNKNSNIQTDGVYYLFDLKNIKYFTRLLNQHSAFLSWLPFSANNLNLDKYDFSNIFDRVLYKIPSKVVDQYLSNESENICLFPHNDIVNDWVNYFSYEREHSCNCDELGRNDLGISIYKYFPNIDKLYI